jgi:DNA helicase-2/ATP-dependent DNA helicase PcrA
MNNTFLYYTNKIKRLFSKHHISSKYIKFFHNVITNRRIVVFDTETTGLDTSNDDIIQIAAVEIIRGVPGKSFECYFATDKDLSPTQTVHNISNEHLAQKATDKKEGLSVFLDFVGGDALLAHNMIYDYTILNTNLLRVGLDSVNKKRNPSFCSLTLTRQLCKLPSYRLGDILASLDLEGDNTHDAMDDTKATVNLALHLKKEIDKNIY